MVRTRSRKALSAKANKRKHPGDGPSSPPSCLYVRANLPPPLDAPRGVSFLQGCHSEVVAVGHRRYHPEVDVHSPSTGTTPTPRATAHVAPNALNTFTAHQRNVHAGTQTPMRMKKLRPAPRHTPSTPVSSLPESTDPTPYVPGITPQRPLYPATSLRPADLLSRLALAAEEDVPPLAPRTKLVPTSPCPSPILPYLERLGLSTPGTGGDRLVQSPVFSPSPSQSSPSPHRTMKRRCVVARDQPRGPGAPWWSFRGGDGDGGGAGAWRLSLSLTDEETGEGREGGWARRDLSGGETFFSLPSLPPSPWGR